MAEQAEALEREDEHLNDEGQGGGDAGDQSHEDQGGEGLDDQTGGQGEGGNAGDEADEFEISFGDEAAPASQGDGSDLVRHLRAEIRKRDEELAVHRRAQPTPAAIELGPKPTLESCDYDGDRFEAELDAWKAKKAKADEAAVSAQQANQERVDAFNARLQVYATGKEALKAKDFDVAEAAVLSKLPQEHVPVFLQATDDPAKLVYALGRHPQKLAELAATKDPIRFAVAVSKLEGQLKVTQRTRTPPDPDTPVRGSAPLTGGKVDPALERLERDAARTGDRTKVVQYKKQQRDRQARK